MNALQLVDIDDPEDPRLEPYRAVRERDLARHDSFIAEGAVVLQRLFAAAGHSADSILVARHKLSGLAQLLADAPASVPVYVAGQAVMDTVVGFHIHRGVLAAGRRGPAQSASDLLQGLPARALVLALCGISNHDNMGGLFRNAAAFGADAVLLDQHCCDPLYRKAIRVSVGAALTTPFARLAGDEDMADLLSAAGFDAIALSPAGSQRLDEVGPAMRQAAIFGAEGPGLPRSLLERVPGVRIEMSGGFDSLNVATSSGVVLHHLARGRPA